MSNDLIPQMGQFDEIISMKLHPLLQEQTRARKALIGTVCIA